MNVRPALKLPTDSHLSRHAGLRELAQTAKSKVP